MIKLIKIHDKYDAVFVYRRRKLAGRLPDVLYSLHYSNYKNNNKTITTLTKMMKIVIIIIIKGV